MNGIDLNDNIVVELTEWGACFLNAKNTFKNMTEPLEKQRKTTYKAGELYRTQLWGLMLIFKDGIRFDKEKTFINLRIDK